LAITVDVRNRRRQIRRRLSSVKNGDNMPVAHEASHNPRANETRPANDEDTHCFDELQTTQPPNENKISHRWRERGFSSPFYFVISLFYFPYRPAVGCIA